MYCFGVVRLIPDCVLLFVVAVFVHNFEVCLIVLHSIHLLDGTR